jgi:[ribosomal protein S5]-alanine N-acetyltransferase
MQTERFYLRQFLPTDAPEHLALNADPDVVRYTGNIAFESLEAAERFFANYAAENYERYGTGRWACIRKEDGAFVGWCGIKYEPNEGHHDLGYRFHKRYWGMGYATETALFSVKYAFETLKIEALFGNAALDNPASAAVLKKVGMTYLRAGRNWRAGGGSLSDYADGV